jgi:serine phosphatase RsbU (regulator of sigma subunit)
MRIPMGTRERPRVGMQATFTSDFKHEYEQVQHSWLQRRFLWYCGVVIGVSVLAMAIVVLAGIAQAKFDDAGFWSLGMTYTIASSVVSVGLYVAAFVHVKRRPYKREAILRIVFWLIVLSGVLTLIQTPLTLAEGFGTPKKSAPDSAPADESPAPVDAAIPAPKHVAGAVPETPSELFTIERAVPSAPAAPEPAKSETDSGDEDDEKEREPTSDRRSALGVTAGNLFNLFITHVFACLFLPWSPRESIRPMVPLLILNAVIMLFYIAQSPVGTLVGLALSPLVAGPGVGICAWRQSRFKDTFTYRMLKSRYGEIRQELHSARQIHESLFPKPVRRGELLFDYRYTPMRQIGGDYLYARAFHLPDRAKPVLNVVVVDVTGHGITAALTVNRLFGEIEREFGEDPSTRPGELLTGLNSYLHHSLATHSVYATALCCRVDPNDDSVEWASAGHPPAFIRAVDGTVERMDSTTFVLGATRGDDFVPDAQKLRFAPGDRLVLYTDGAIEARNEQGRMLSVAGFERMIAATSEPGLNGVILDQLLDALERYRHGPPSDDTLLVEVMRAI